MKAIDNGNLRARAVDQEGAAFVHIDVRDADGGWRTLLGNGIVAPKSHWQTELTAHRPDPQIEWKTGSEDAELQSVEGAFDQAAVSDDGKTLTLTGQAECHAVEMTLSLPEDGRYEGSLFWTARAADFLDGYDTGAMGVTAWWLMNWNDHFDLGAGAMDNVVAYARFLGAKQLPSGAVPTFFLKDLEPARPLAESATTAISGAVLARAAKITGDNGLKEAALEAGRFIEEQVIPGLAFTDFETIYSCSSKPMDATDYWTGIRAHNNLSIGWACDQMLALYRLTGDDKWLRHGEHLLSILSFYQQVWNPSHRSGYLYGGFGGLPDGSYTVGVNGAACENRSASELSAGIAVRITA